MYNLENEITWTVDLKEAFKHGVTRCQINLGNGIVYDENNNLLNAELVENRNVPNLGFIGQATARQLTIELMSIDENINLENREIEFKIGADYNGDTYYINYGNFIVTKSPENDDTNGKIKITAYDYMIKFNKDYVAGVTFPCTLQAVFNDLCSQCGVEVGSTSFTNSNFIVENNQFEGKSCREVLQNIAQCAFSWARIKQDNKCYLDFDCVSYDTPPETLPVGYSNIITDEEYKANAFKKANEYYGGINRVTYAQTNITGQEESVENSSAISQYGLKELILYDNLFAYTNAKRHTLIQGGTKLLGLLYMPVQQMDLIGLVYLEGNDFYQVNDMEDNPYFSYPLNHTIRYNGAVSDSISAIGESANEQTYKNNYASSRVAREAEVSVDRANATIKLLATEVTEVSEKTAEVEITVDGLSSRVTTQDSKISEITQTVDEINSKISDISDITVAQESEYASVHLDDVNESEPIMIRVHPTTQNLLALYPRTNLYPSTQNWPVTRRIRFTRNYTEDGVSKTQNIYYEIPDDLLVYDELNYDEFYLDYDSHTCEIIKRCGLNSNGSVYLLENEVINSYPYPTIILGDGDYDIVVENNQNTQYCYLFARLMAKNIYTTQFYTKTETNSLISQTVDSIDLSVNRKLSNYSTTAQTTSAINLAVGNLSLSVNEKFEDYSTTSEMTSAINLAANQLSLSVSQTYATKASVDLKIDKSDNGQIISMINASADRITLNAGRLVVNSTNFKLNSNGDVTATNVDITGKITATSGAIGGINITNSGIFSYGDSDYVGFGIWKQGLHQSENSSIIFHAGGNTAHIGGAMTRIYANGIIHTRGIYYTARDNNSGALLGKPLLIRARYNSNTQVNQGEIGILQGNFGIIDGTSNDTKVPLFIDTGQKELNIGYTYDETNIMNGRNYQELNNHTYGGNIVSLIGTDHIVNVFWDGSYLWCYIDGQNVGRINLIR